MGDKVLAKIIHRVAKMLVTLLEEEFKKDQRERNVNVVIVHHHIEPPT